MKTARESPQVSVVIPTHNRASTVVRAIQSVLKQTYQNFEIIVVDDGSTDNTRKTLQDLPDQRLQYIRHDRNLGGSAARNTGIDVAAGEYIAFLDSDDEWLPEKLNKQVGLLQGSEAAVGAVYAGYVAISENGASAIKIPRDRGTILCELFAANTVGTASTVIVRRECIRRVGGFDTAIGSCQDWDMWIRLAKHYRFDFVPEALVHYHLSANGRITNNWRAVVDGHLRIAEKYLTDIASLPQRQRAETLFSLGSHLVELGLLPHDPKLMRRGGRFLLGAFKARPRTLRYLVHYGASFNGTAYRILTRAKPRFAELLDKSIFRAQS